MQTGVGGREKKAAVNTTLMNTEQYAIKQDYTIPSQKQHSYIADRMI